MQIEKIFVAGDSFGLGAGLASEELLPNEEIFKKRFNRKELMEFTLKSGNLPQEILRKHWDKDRDLSPRMTVEEKKRSYCAIIENKTGIKSTNISIGGGSMQSMATSVFQNLVGEEDLDKTLLILNLTSFYRQMVPCIDRIYTNILTNFTQINIPKEVADWQRFNARDEYYLFTGLVALKSIQQFASENKMTLYYVDSYLYSSSLQMLSMQTKGKYTEFLDQLPDCNLTVYPGLVDPKDKVWMPCGHHDHSVQEKIADHIIKDFSFV